jgi:hypothetical protein
MRFINEQSNVLAQEDPKDHPFIGQIDMPQHRRPPADPLQRKRRQAHTRTTRTRQPTGLRPEQEA